MKLNLGCGFRRLDGWVNADASPLCAPDQVVDLERMPWPWPDDCIDEVLLSHVLEHLGRTAANYLEIMGELWRVCRPDARITIVVPHPRHDDFLHDPTHLRPVTSEGLALFSQRLNRQWIAQGAGNSTLGLMLGIDLEVTETRHLLDEPWRGRVTSGELARDALTHAMRSYNNVIKETTLVLRVIKPAGRDAG